jgi:hypothetical protein
MAKITVVLHGNSSAMESMAWMTCLYSEFSGSPAGERASRLGGYFLILVTESLYCKPEPDLECRRLRHCDSDCHCEPEMLPVPPWAAPRICSLLVWLRVTDTLATAGSLRLTAMAGCSSSGHLKWRQLGSESRDLISLIATCSGCSLVFSKRGLTFLRNLKKCNHQQT